MKCDTAGWGPDGYDTYDSAGTYGNSAYGGDMYGGGYDGGFRQLMAEISGDGTDDAATGNAGGGKARRRHARRDLDSGYSSGYGRQLWGGMYGYGYGGGYGGGCIAVSHVHDNPGYYTCDCVPPGDGCFGDGCVETPECPDVDGQEVSDVPSPATHAILMVLKAGETL